jgi:hypothetical protein
MPDLWLPSVQLQCSDGRVTVRAPYHPDWPAAAKRLGGRWDPGNKTWQFDLRDAERVRQELVRVYGWDGSYPVEIVDLRIRLDLLRASTSSSIWIYGRMVAERPARDSRVRLGSGVVLVTGGFPSSGGSRKYPEVSPLPGTVVEMRDVAMSDEVRSDLLEIPDVIQEVAGSRRTISGPEQPPVPTGAPKRRIELGEQEATP